MFRLLFTIFLLSAVASNTEAYLLREAPRGDWVRWHQSEVEIILDSSLGVMGSMRDVERTIIAGFQLWEKQTPLPVRFRFTRADCSAFRDAPPNCIMACVEPNRCKKFSKDKGATTQLRYSRRGKIFSADIVINTKDWEWRMAGTDGPGLDLQFVIAHEAGHFIGIRHSDMPEALMYATMSQTDPRPLHLARDDLAAVEALYGDGDGRRQGHIGGVWKRMRHRMGERGLLILHMFLLLVSLVLYRRETPQVSAEMPAAGS